MVLSEYCLTFCLRLCHFWQKLCQKRFYEIGHRCVENHNNQCYEFGHTSLGYSSPT